MANASVATAVEHADRAQRSYLQSGQERAAARAEAIAGRALRSIGRHAEARQRLTAALAVLRADPDRDTVTALEELAVLEVFAGSPDADRLTAEALALGQELDVDASQLYGLFLTQGIRLFLAGYRPEGFAYLRESVLLATQAGDYSAVGHALVNLAGALSATDAAAAAEAGQTAAGHLRRVGNQAYLTFAVENLAQALLDLGDWDAAEAELARSMQTDGLTGEYLIGKKTLLLALRGNASTAQALLAELPDMRASEDHQDNATINLLRAFIAAADGQPDGALRHARDVVAHAGAIGMSHEGLRWGWPLAARISYQLRDTGAIRELLALADSCRPGQLVPIIRAERDLLRARLAGRDGDHAARAALTAALTGLRDVGSPYHLAHGLLDHAEYLIGVGDGDTAATAVTEARGIGDRLNCPPLLERADAVERIRPQVRA
jgi:tetratricopeptide (TPR) repeat protein